MNYQNILYIIIFVLLAFLVILFFVNWFSVSNENFSMCNYDHLILPENDISTLRELLLKLVAFFNSNNIRYFAIGGTLLGIERNGGLMPFDDDIDLGILNEDTNKIDEYKDDDFYFTNAFFGYKFKKKDNDRMFIDIMIFEKVNNVYKIIQNNFPEEYFYENELFPLKEKTFSGIISLSVPHDYISYLNRSYKNYDKEIKLQNSHFETTDRYNSLPKSFDVNYDNGKYLCYTKL